jgi:hypothetical protein
VKIKEFEIFIRDSAKNYNTEIFRLECHSEDGFYQTRIGFDICKNDKFFNDLFNICIALDFEIILFKFLDGLRIKIENSKFEELNIKCIKPLLTIRKYSL